MQEVSIEYFDLSVIATHAKDLLIRTSRENEIPVDIEMIVESDLGIRPIPVHGLMDRFNIDGFTSSDFTSIYVDQDIFWKSEQRYRFTLAHEVGHCIMHREVLSETEIKTLEDWIAFYSNMNEWTRGRFEFQGNAFAGMLLVPSNHLLKSFNENLTAIMDRINEAQERGISRSQYINSALDFITTRLCKQFNVSRGVIERRISAENLSDGIP
ncbi:MAG: ImmA/IrrE family metallo-endopeptidase [Candidatus Aegiribacteria sp.]|nr:ImmA/IrrE family metallo-endopeptidase [Candidatus Aegiribacteria sp.]